MRWFLSGVGCIALATSTSALAQQVMTGEQIAAIAERARSYVPRDQFDAPPPVPSLAGKRFSYVLKPLERGPDNAICGGFPSWGYFTQEGLFEVGMDPGSTLSYQLRNAHGAIFPKEIADVRLNSDLKFHSLTCKKVREPSYTAGNAYGAEVEVRKETDVVNAIANFETYREARWKTYWSSKIPGDTARQLSQNVQVRISGTLDDWWPGTAVLCGARSSTPTIQRPRDKTLDICMVKGRSDHLEVINAATGEILYSAKR